MTPQTVKDLAELGMTPEALAEKTRQVEASLHTPDPHDKPGEPSMQAINSILGRTRQPSSDKGTTRPPKPKPAAIEAPAQAGALTVEMVETLRDISNRRLAAHRILIGDQRRVDDLDAEWHRTLDSLTASK